MILTAALESGNTLTTKSLTFLHEGIQERQGVHKQLMYVFCMIYALAWTDMGDQAHSPMREQKMLAQRGIVSV